jgi:two-component system response regulator DesR
MIRILIAEDMRILRDTLVAVLDLEADLEVVAAVESGDHVVPAALRHCPDVAIVDIDLPAMDGLTAAVELHEKLPTCRILVLTGLRRPGNVRRAVMAQVSGFMLKDAPSEELVDAVRQIAAGGRVFDSKLAIDALGIAENPLSNREAEVLRRYADGASAAEIAAGLFLSYGTVRNYLASAVTKLGARNRIDAVRIAREAGYL